MGGFSLEKWKFGVYLVAPIIAVVFYSIPSVHETSLNMSRYVVHPPSLVPAHFAAAEQRAKVAAQAKRATAAVAEASQ